MGDGHSAKTGRRPVKRRFSPISPSGHQPIRNQLFDVESRGQSSCLRLAPHTSHPTVPGALKTRKSLYPFITYPEFQRRLITASSSSVVDSKTPFPPLFHPLLCNLSSRHHHRHLGKRVFLPVKPILPISSKSFRPDLT